MYQGVIKDELRTRNKATAAAAARLQTASQGATIIPSVASASAAVAPLNTPGAPIQRSYDLQSIPSNSTSASASSSSSFSSSWWSSTPSSSPASIRRFDEPDHSLMGVGVAQPSPLVDEDCTTCIVSPPPQLAEAQSKEQRQREREERLAEYEAQKRLAGRLEREQRVQEPQARLV